MKECYKEFIKKFGQHLAVIIIGLSNISLLPNSNDLIRILKLALKTKEDAVAGIRFASNVINGVLIDDAYIYRLS